jgi:hypothetical protein
VKLGGAHLVYRFQIDFDQPVKLSSITETALGDYQTGNNDSVLRLCANIRCLDDNSNVLSTLSTAGLPETLISYTLATGAIGQTFILEEFDNSTVGRYRSHIGVAFQPACILPTGEQFQIPTTGLGSDSPPSSGWQFSSPPHPL